MTTLLTALFAAWISVCFIALVCFALVIQGGRDDEKDETWN